MNKDVLNTIYMSPIQPLMDYACTVWGSSDQGHKDLIVRIQRREARIVSGIYDYINCRGADIKEAGSLDTCKLLYKRHSFNR